MPASLPRPPERNADGSPRSDCGTFHPYHRKTRNFDGDEATTSKKRAEELPPARTGLRRRPRRLDAPANAHEQPQRAPGVPRRPYPEPGPEPALYRIDQRVRPVEPRHHALVEPAEPGKLQQLRPRQVEDEGGDAE